MRGRFEKSNIASQGIGEALSLSLSIVHLKVGCFWISELRTGPEEWFRVCSWDVFLSKDLSFAPFVPPGPRSLASLIRTMQSSLISCLCFHTFSSRERHPQTAFRVSHSRYFSACWQHTTRPTLPSVAMRPLSWPLGMSTLSPSSSPLQLHCSSRSQVSNDLPLPQDLHRSPPFCLQCFYPIASQIPLSLFKSHGFRKNSRNRHCFMPSPPTMLHLLILRNSSTTLNILYIIFGDIIPLFREVGFELWIFLP